MVERYNLNIPYKEFVCPKIIEGLENEGMKQWEANILSADRFEEIHASVVEDIRAKIKAAATEGKFSVQIDDTKAHDYFVNQGYYVSLTKGNGGITTLYMTISWLRKPY